MSPGDLYQTLESVRSEPSEITEDGSIVRKRPTLVSSVLFARGAIKLNDTGDINTSNTSPNIENIPQEVVPKLVENYSLDCEYIVQEREKYLKESLNFVLHSENLMWALFDQLNLHKP